MGKFESIKNVVYFDQIKTAEEAKKLLLKLRKDGYLWDGSGRIPMENDDYTQYLRRQIIVYKDTKTIVWSDVVSDHNVTIREYIGEF